MTDRKKSKKAEVKKAQPKKKQNPKIRKKVTKYADVGFDLIPENETSDEQAQIPQDSVLKEVNGRTLLAFKQNEKIKINFSLIIHGMALLLIVFLISCGVSSAIKGLLAVYTKIIGVSTAYILPMCMLFLGI